MKIISTCLFLLLSGFVFSQFNRTYLHATSTRSTFSSCTFLDDQNQQYLFSLGNGTSNQIELVTQKLDGQGEVLEAVHQNYTLTVPSGLQNQYILGVAENQTERFYTLEIGNNSALNIVWLKVDKNTGALLSSQVSTYNYRLGYFEAKMIGNELVSYHVKSSGGLIRLAINTTSFALPSEEMVDATITTSSGFANTINGWKSGNLLLVNGLEKVVFAGGITSAKLFTRTAANTYSSITTGIAANRSVSSFLINPTTIGITNGMAIEHYNASGSLVTSGTFSSNSILSINQVAFIDNGYHIFTKPMGTGTPSSFFKANASFTVTDSLKGIVPAIYQIFSSNGANFILGNGLTKGVSEDLSGNASAGMSVFCEKYLETPVLDFSEYSYKFKTGSKGIATIGLGTKVIAVSPNGLTGSTYDNRSACYNLNERFVGFTNTDTLANDQSTYADQYDELPGPYTTNALYDEVVEAKYNRPCHVSLQMIEDHIDSVQMGSSSYIPVVGIRNWPAHGNTALGQAADLAPFVDANSNGVYEPLLGDYPQIYGNDCVFSITHYRDNGNANNALEFHSYVYTQLCDTNETFDDVLMRKVKIISRGVEIDSLFFGGHFDGDMGNYNDDYIGTNVDLGLIYNYNGDLFDEPNSGRPGFNDTLPAQGILVLKGFKQADDGLDNGIGIQPGKSVNGYGFNDGVIDNEYSGLYASAAYTGTNAPAGQSDPTSAISWYNVLDGRFQFGDEMYYGGTGFSGAPCVTAIATNYMFPGDSDTLHWGTAGVDPGFSWSEFEPCGTGSTSNPSGDRRGAYSFGKTTLSNGETIELDYAYLIKRKNEPTTGILEPVTDLFVKASAVRSAFLSNEGPCGINFDPISESLGIEESVIEGDLFTVYPNPTTGLVQVNGISETGGTIRIFDINGKLLQTVTNYQAMQNLDLSELQGNMFILQISSESKTAQKRVVKY
nr:T9SS type A sorting domain-containing protein [uncultured Fluviicola sp.]